MPTCKSCSELKAKDEFYASNRNVCKECIKERVRANRLSNLEYYRQYDRNRSNRPERIAARKAYAQTEAYRVAHLKADKNWRISNARRKYATGVISNLIKLGQLTKQPCLICGRKRAEAHHFDYGLPENVIWLCDRHHKDAHKIDKEINRQIKYYEQMIKQNDDKSKIAA
ncbi:hypothetical protein [Snodgrassella alvi]|jgi:hypothetical protein|uniref:hypothetical protein n=1 Tax=Snodgrassella alvi TaxID=1196083 RepID=UPI000C1EE60A|nr:hypothetical protein [Snodgrassella alvi]PIT43378.1 hypothetical protein BHC51_11125 [Snodgrassella alvi]